MTDVFTKAIEYVNKGKNLDESLWLASRGSRYPFRYERALVHFHASRTNYFRSPNQAKGYMAEWEQGEMLTRGKRRKFEKRAALRRASQLYGIVNPIPTK